MASEDCAGDAEAPEAVVRRALKGQYHAALAMLRQAIEICPADLWTESDSGAPFWRVAYHALYYADLYLRADENSFTPWESHQTGIQDLDDIPASPELQKLLELPSRPPQNGVPYAREELLGYLDVCDRLVDDAIDEFDVWALNTGFSWHTPQRSKIEQHVDGIRHIQHHTTQLAGRVHAANGTRVEWVGTRPTEQIDRG